MGASTFISRVQSALEDSGAECPIEEVTGLCPELSWNQVFIAIDYLSRSGQVRVTPDPGRTYKVQAVPPQASRGPFVAYGT